MYNYWHTEMIFTTHEHMNITTFSWDEIICYGCHFLPWQCVSKFTLSPSGYQIRGVFDDNSISNFTGKLAYLFHCLEHTRPNHCGRHLGKINGHKSTYIKVWGCTFWWITMFLTGKSWVKLFEYQAEVFVGLDRQKRFGNGKFNPVTDHTTCHRLLFQAYEFAMHFRTSRCDITEYAIAKGRHCHCD